MGVQFFVSYSAQTLHVHTQCRFNFTWKRMFANIIEYQFNAYFLAFFFFLYHLFRSFYLLCAFLCGKDYTFTILVSKHQLKTNKQTNKQKQGKNFLGLAIPSPTSFTSLGRADHF